MNSLKTLLICQLLSVNSRGRIFDNFNTLQYCEVCKLKFAVIQNLRRFGQKLYIYTGGEYCYIHHMFNVLKIWSPAGGNSVKFLSTSRDLAIG